MMITDLIWLARLACFAACSLALYLSCPDPDDALARIASFHAGLLDFYVFILARKFSTTSGKIKVLASQFEFIF